MALVVTLDDAKMKTKKFGGDPSRGIVSTPFFGSSRSVADSPHAKLTQHSSQSASSTHFHIVDQFQVVVGGKGKLGRHDLTPYCVHFSRAYTPYGPLSSDTRTPMTFFGLRAHCDPGGQHLPQALDRLKQVPDRQPWQITRPVAFPALQSGTAAAEVMLRAVSDIKDENGLAAYTLSMKPDAKTAAPDPSQGDGQYLVLVKGSLLHGGKEHKALALVFVYPKENAFQIHAGSEGLETLVLNFPVPKHI